MKRLLIKKIFASLVAVIFMATTLSQNVIASGIIGATPLSANIAAGNPLQLQSVLPLSIGKITNISAKHSSPHVIINVQDLHSHAQTQRNINQIINLLAKNYKVSAIYAEGGMGDISVDWINQIQDNELRSRVIEQLLEDGILSASEYYAMTNKEALPLKGIEDREIHQTNLKRLASFQDNKARYQATLEKIEKEIKVLNKLYTNRRNVKFNKILSDYENREITDTKFYRILAKYVETIGRSPEKYNNFTRISLENYPNISAYAALLQDNQKINSNAVSIELQRVINDLKTTLPYRDYKYILDETDNFQDTDKVIELLSVIARSGESRDAAIHKLPNLNKLIKINELARQLNPVELLTEQRNLTERIKFALAYDNIEAEISFITDFFKYFKDYMYASLTQDDWIYVKENMPQFIEIFNKYSAGNYLEEISDSFADITAYYDLNTKRNEIFLKELGITPSSPVIPTKVGIQVNKQNDKVDSDFHRNDTAESTSELLKNASDIKIVVTGGYHSEGLKNLLSDKKVSLIQITPNVTTDISKAQKTYESIIKEQAKLPKNALSFVLPSSSGVLYQQALVVKVLQGKNFNFSPEQIKALGISQEVIDYVKDNKVEIDETQAKTLFDSIKNFTGDIKTIFKGETLTKAEIEIINALSSIVLLQKKEEGAIPEIEQAGLHGQDILGVSPTDYSRWTRSAQERLLDKYLASVSPSSAKLELSDIAAEADARGLTGIKRAFFVSRKEFITSLSPKFVSKHYGRYGPSEADKQTEAYKTRRVGDFLIKAMSLAGLSLGAVIPAVLLTTPFIIPIAALSAFILTFVFNVATHMVYNLSVSKEKRLELSSRQAEKEKVMAEFPAFRGNLDTTVWNFNVQHNNYGYLFENNDNFRDSRGRNWSDIRNELMSAWDFDSVQKSIQNLLNFAYAIASRMNEKHGEEFLMKVISEIYKLTEKIPFNMGKDIITLTPWEPSSQFDKYTSKKRDLQVDEFALFEKFIDFNRIALAELGSGDIASIENSKKALMEMINIIKVLESLIVLRPGEVKISVSEEAEKRLKNMTGAAELNGIINYVHQEGIKVIKTGGINGNAEVFEFKTIKTDIEAPRDSGYPNNEFNIKVYNYSQEPLTEHMIEFLSNLRLKGLPKEGAANFSLFIKNNTVIFDMSMGEHSVYFVMHLDDLNQGMYGVYNESHRKHGNNARAGLFAREAALLGADITRFDNLPAEINMDGTSDKTKELIIVLHKYMKELERENSDKSLLEEYIRSIHSLSNKNIYIADFILKTLSSKKAIDELSVLKIMVLFGNSDSLTNRKITLLSKKTLTEDERKELERINSALPHYNPRTQNSILKFNNFLSKVKLYIDAKKTKDSAAIQKAEENLKNYMEEISRVEDKDNEIIINVIEQILQGKEDVDISAYEKRLEYGFLKEQLEIINGILIKKYKKGIEEINEIPDVRISLYVPGAGGFNMFHRAGDVFSAPSDYADMISKLLLVFMQSIGLDRELEGNNAGDLVDDRADIGDFDISNAVRLGFAEQDKIRQRISLQEFQSMKGRIREDGGRYLLFDFGRRNRLKNLSGVPPVISSLERKIAEGSIIIDENGNLIENQRYNPVQDITDILSKESKNKEFFKQGDIIRHLLNNRLSFKSLSLNFDGYIGQMQVLSGVMRLPDGYLSVKVICNPEDNQIYGVDSEFVDISGKGREISVSELMDIFKIKEKEVPEISEKEKAYINKKLERKPLKSKFHFQSLGSAVYRGQMAGVVTYDERMLDKSKIWFVSQIAPDDRTAMSKAGGVVTNGGNRYSHIGVLTREAKVPSVFLSQSVMQSGEMTVPVFETVEEKDVNGFTMVIVKQTNRAIKEGDFVIIDGDRIYVLNEEERRQFEADRKIPVDRQEIEYAISDNLETAERMLDRKNAVKSLEAYTIILKTERILKDTKIRVNQDIQVRLDELKRQSIDSIRSFAKEVIVDAEGILRLKVNLKREQIDALFKYQRMITYWQSFYGLVRIDELMQRINERIESIKKTAGAMKSLDEMGVEYENDIGSKAANIIFLRKIFNGKKFNGFRVEVPGGRVAGHSAIENIFGQEYKDLISRFIESVNQKTNNGLQAYASAKDIREFIERNGEKLKSLDIKGLKDLIYAIRSTGIGEDSALNAFAGMGETELNIRRGEVEKAILKVLVSFFEKRSVDYMLETGQIVLPAILVQEMVQDVVSAGQIFSVNENGDTEIEGVLNLGEGSVSGRVSADGITFKIKDDIYLYNKADDRVMKIVPAENGGTKAVPVGEEEKHIRVFANDLIVALKEIAETAEQEFGYPVDMEFAIKDVKGEPVISLLQARPITTFVIEGDDILSEADISAAISAGKLVFVNPFFKDEVFEKPALNQKELSELLEERQEVLSAMEGKNFGDVSKDPSLGMNYRDLLREYDVSIAKYLNEIKEQFSQELGKQFSPAEIRYLEVLNKFYSIGDQGEKYDYLLNIMSNETLPVYHRLYAFLNLRLYFEYSVDNDLKEKMQSLSADFLKYVNSSNYFTGYSRYDLQAALAGTHLTVLLNANDGLVIPDSQEKGSEKSDIGSEGIYGLISKAIIVNGTNANSHLIFSNHAAFVASTMAHELGHIYLNIYLKQAAKEKAKTEQPRKAETVSTVHEFFADAIGELFLAAIGYGTGRHFATNKIGFKLFFKGYNAVVQEHHRAARGFEKVLISVSESLSKTLNWNAIAVLIVSFILTDFKDYNAQSTMFEKFVRLYADRLFNEFGIPQEATLEAFKSQATVQYKPDTPYRAATTALTSDTTYERTKEAPLTSNSTIVDFKPTEASKKQELIKSLQIKNNVIRVMVVNDDIKGDSFGIKVPVKDKDGNIIKWVSVRGSIEGGHLIVYANSAQNDDIISAVKDNKNFRKELSKATGIKEKDLDFLSVSTDQEEGTQTRYENGILKISKKDYDTWSEKGFASFEDFVVAKELQLRAQKQAEIETVIQSLEKDENWQKTVESILKQKIYVAKKFSIVSSQYDDLMSFLQKNNVSLFDLRQLGVEFYISGDNAAIYKQSGFSGALTGADIHDYYADKTYKDSLLSASENITEAGLLNLLKSGKYVVVDINTIRTLLKKERSGLVQYNLVDMLTDKLNFILGDVTPEKAAATAYNFSLDLMPNAINVKSAIDAINAINAVPVLKNYYETIKTDEAKDAFINAIYEMILIADYVKNCQTQVNNKGKKIAIADGKMKKALGQLLALQAALQAEAGVVGANVSDEVSMMDYISEANDSAKEKLTRAQAAANAIEMIEVYNFVVIDENKNKDRVKQVNITATYRAVLSAA